MRGLGVRRAWQRPEIALRARSQEEIRKAEKGVALVDAELKVAMASKDEPFVQAMGPFCVKAMRDVRCARRVEGTDD